MDITRLQLREELIQAPDYVVWRADGDAPRDCLVQTLRAAAPTSRQLARLRREHDLLLRLDGGALRPRGIDAAGRTLVLEGFDGVPVPTLLPDGAATLADRVRIAIGAVRALALVHARDVVHKDVSPHRMLARVATGEVRLLGFGVASELSREAVLLHGTDQLEGTLAYMAPEQTGRMNRSVDYRSDFYALGVTLYELFTRRRPFYAADALGLVHAHLARAPRPPAAVDGAVPESLSDLVLRLLAKEPDDRY
ncbi:MAG: serine/threonine protein kinase, partial [Myxococcales bacterium]|nr:serine/threonine protein kinase [Myxococcales bacterium]